MKNTLLYLFDPLCGWCYGASRGVADLVSAHGITVELLPTALFSGPNARPMNAEMAHYIWNSDLRIAAATGQAFSERYRDQVLADHSQSIDSAPATMALTAVRLTEPARELEALRAIQHARYVEGRDITSSETLRAVLAELGLEQAAARAAQPDAVLLEANHARITRAQGLMQRSGAGGVPTFIADNGSRQWLVPSSAAYAHPQTLFAHLQAA